MFKRFILFGLVALTALAMIGQASATIGGFGTGIAGGFGVGISTFSGGFSAFGPCGLFGQYGIFGPLGLFGYHGGLFGPQGILFPNLFISGWWNGFC